MGDLRGITSEEDLNQYVPMDSMDKTYLERGSITVVLFEVFKLTLNFYCNA